jgi:predicted Ser/Thr protein kinase
MVMQCCNCGQEFDSVANEKYAHLRLCPNCSELFKLEEPTATRATTPLDLAALQLPDRFRPEMILGEGAFGVVYKCWDQKLRRFVAIKTARNESIDQQIFVREARAASQLKHPGIVQVFDVCESHGTSFIVSEFVEGATLKIWLSQNHPSLDQICQICEDIAVALAAAHQQGIIHRDVKPGNILIDDQGHPKLLDFGLSHSRQSGFDTLLIEGHPIGTPAYMSPEQVEGRATSINTWSDVYSLGVIFYQMMVGKLPFRGTSREMLTAILSETPELPSKLNSQVPAVLDAICMKALAKSINERFQSAAEFAECLRRYRQGLPVPAYRRPYARRIRKIARRIAIPAILGTGLIVAVIGLAFWKKHAVDLPKVDVLVDSVPLGAKLHWQRFDFDKGLFDSKNASETRAGEVAHLASGFYRVRAASDGEYFEVFRTIPANLQSTMLFEFQFHKATVICAHRWSLAEDNVVKLRPIHIVPEAQVGNGRAWYSKGTVHYPDSEGVMERLRGRSEEVDSFLMGCQEVTWGDLQRAFAGLELPAETTAMSVARDIPLDIALAYSEKVGCNLPTFAELYFAATNSGKTRFPWGNQSTRPAGEAGDNNLGTPPVRDLLGGVSEWTETPFVVALSDVKLGRSQAPSVGPITFIPMPESWLTISGDGTFWTDATKGIGPTPLGTLSYGFRTVRRLKPN